MKNTVILLSLIVFLFACNEDEDPQPLQISNLESTGILGNWEIQDRITGNISDLTAKCCEFLLFEEDTDISDLKGKMTSTSIGSATEWNFILNPGDSTITLERNETTLERKYIIDDDLMTLEYLDDSIRISEVWKRQ